MKWAIIIFTILTALCGLGSRGTDGMDSAFLMLGMLAFGAIDFVLIIIWLAIT